jgi:3-phosphoshikimate 1-carboxyvinyltransferase
MTGAPAGTRGRVRRIQGSLRVPGDKSVSHRALLFAAIATAGERSRIRHILDSADVRSTAGVLRALGVAIAPGPLPGDMEIEGVGLSGFRAPAEALDCGNSGTTARLTCGMVAALPFRSRFVGDRSLSRRPMGRVADPLRAMGATVTFEHGDGLPMDVSGGPVRSIEWRSESGSAQVKSAILLAGEIGGVAVTIRAPHGSRDHTERFLVALGADVVVRDEGREVSLVTPRPLAPFDLAVPADPSSAAFFAALAATAEAGELRLTDVLRSPARDGFLLALAAMGARVEVDTIAPTASGEETATYIVGPGVERGIRIGAGQTPAMIDELPLLACVAARAAPGQETVVSGAAELRVKESDRIAATVANLRAVGVDAEESPDGFRVVGVGRRALRGRVVTHGDHRVAMAFGILGALHDSAIEIDEPACVAVSYPDFWADLDRVLA